MMYSRTEERLRRLRFEYEDCCDYYGEDDPQTVRALYKLGMARFKAGDMSAYDELEPVYQSMSDVEDEDSPEMLKLMHALGVTCMYNDYPCDGYELLSKVYRLRCEILGEKHPDTLDTLHWLGRTYIWLGHDAKAYSTLQKAYTQRREVLGEKHRDTLKTLRLLIQAAKYADKPAERESCIAIYEKVTGKKYRESR